MIFIPLLFKKPNTKTIDILKKKRYNNSIKLACRHRKERIKNGAK